MSDKATGPSDPIAAAQRLARKELPHRFYERAALAREADRFVVTLDGRPAKTPGRKPLAVDAPVVAEALAAEWEAQADVVDPAAMPLTRLVNTALDRVVDRMDEVRADIVRYAGSDLICYRAGEPEALAGRQREIWDPLVAWAEQAFGARPVLAEGVMAVAQPPELGAAVASAVAPLGPLPLAGAHAATTTTGSAFIVLALKAGQLTPDAAWDAAHLDEDWQMGLWGPDELALAARAVRRADFDAAVLAMGIG